MLPNGTEIFMKGDISCSLKKMIFYQVIVWILIEIKIFLYGI